MTGPSAQTERLRAWSHRRQSLGRARSDPARALADVVAVYSTQPTAALSLAARTAALDPADLGEWEDRRAAVRVPGMRRSIFLAPVRTASVIFAATREPVAKHAGLLRAAGFDPETYEALADRVLALAAEPVTADAAKRAIPTDGRLLAVLQVLAYEGRLLRLGGGVRTDNLRYVATEAWLGRPLADGLDPDGCLAELAGWYLRAFGPARPADFAWWAGVGRARAAAAFVTVPTDDVGAGLLLPADQRDAFDAVGPPDPDVLDVLPKWDAYLMGYAPDGRGRLVDDGQLPAVYSFGDGLPVILAGGRAVATWKHRFTGDRLRVSWTPLGPGAPAAPQVERHFADAARVLGATAVEVQSTG